MEIRTISSISTMHAFLLYLTCTGFSHQNFTRLSLSPKCTKFPAKQIFSPSWQFQYHLSRNANYNALQDVIFSSLSSRSKYCHKHCMKKRRYITTNAAQFLYRTSRCVNTKNGLYIVQQSNTTSNIYLIINEWATAFGH